MCQEPLLRAFPVTENGGGKSVVSRGRFPEVNVGRGAWAGRKNNSLFHEEARARVMELLRERVQFQD